MNRRTFSALVGMTAMDAVANRRLFAEQPGSEAEIVLEDSTLRCEFDPHTGALTRMVAKDSGWVIQERAGLGVSFRLHAPLPNRRDNFVLGARQTLASVQRLAPNRLRFTWTDLVSEHGGKLPIKFSGIVTLSDGDVSFSGELTNGSPLVVETIDYPYIGDLKAAPGGPRMQAMCQRYDNLETAEIHPHFGNEKGYWGTDFPTKTFESYNSLFCLLQGEQHGLYVEMRDPTSPYLVEYTFEQHPGVISNRAPFSSMGAAQTGDVQLVPESDSISGLPVHLEFRTCHFVFAKAGAKKSLVPIRLRPYRGDWHAGVDIYKAWRKEWYQAPMIPAWARGVHSWCQLQLNSSEEEFRIPYRDLPAYADECAKYGVRAIQLTGWNHGGQDRGNPSQDTDPGLGTREEFKQAIAYFEKKGVRVILFGKFPWADMTTDWYKNELHRYAATDPFGVLYQYGGDSYHTPTQLAAINNRQFAVMDFCAPGYREIAVKEFRKILDLKPSGWLYDEVCFHGPVKYSFSPDHGYEAPGYQYAYDLVMARLFRSEADKVNREFFFAGEGPQDWLTQFYPGSYYRGSATPIEQYIAPGLPMIVAVNGFDDREQINRILLQRCIIGYEPFNFKGKLSEFPLTMAYGQKVDALRRQYAAFLWDGEFRDTVGAAVRCSTGNARDVSYSVFRAQDGKRAVVVVNERADSPIEVSVDLPNPRAMVAATPEAPTAVAVSGNVSIAPRSAVVLMEN